MRRLPDHTPPHSNRLVGVPLLTTADPTAAGQTFRITIRGPNLAVPITIGLEEAPKFQVWEHPETQSLICDWAAGPIQPPDLELLYIVQLHTGRDAPYTVFYAFDAVAGKGYVYISGPAHPVYRDNTRSIFYGIEGKWFRAWSEWEKLAHPLIAKASRSGKAR